MKSINTQNTKQITNHYRTTRNGLRKKLLILIIVLLNVNIFSQDKSYMSFVGDTVNSITDLVLIYQGGAGRPKWTKEEFAPYVAYNKNNESNWLFDGFLFVEFRDGRGYKYIDSYIKNNLPARKTEWQNLINMNFSKDVAIDALNKAIGEAQANIGKPARKRKVILTLPTPVPNQKDWGEIDGKSLDFSVRADRIAATKWYAEEVIKTWNQLNPENLELAGFYWVTEDMFTDNDYIIPQISTNISDLGKKLYWIPYSGAKKVDKWRELKFDVVYRQANYFFNLNNTIDVIIKACDAAMTNNIGVEFEFDNRLLLDTQYLKRYYDYINIYKSYNVFKSAAVAYYEGAGVFGKMSRAQDTNIKKAYNHLAEIISERQYRADNIYVQKVNSEITLDSTSSFRINKEYNKKNINTNNRIDNYSNLVFNTTEKKLLFDDYSNESSKDNSNALIKLQENNIVLNINCNEKENKNLNVLIIDISGKIIYKQKHYFVNGENIIDIYNLNLRKGLYIVNIEDLKLNSKIIIN